jgi:pyruvate,orthophosphate dikinase
MTDSKQAQRWVYSFHELKEVEALPAIGGSWEKVVNFLGGKGAGLFRMSDLGLPVPPGFTLTTEACLHYQGVKTGS